MSDWFFSPERKSAEWINRDFLRWFAGVASRRVPSSCFSITSIRTRPYLLPPGARHRFGVNPEIKKDYVEVLMDWSSLDKQRLPRRYSSLAQRCLR